jgi:hypothetical protein
MDKQDGNLPMDELRMVRWLLPKPPAPASATVAAARAGLQQSISGRSHARGHWPPVGLRRGLLLTAIASAAAVAAAVTLIPGGAARTGAGTARAGPGSHHGQANGLMGESGQPVRQFLLTVALRASRDHVARYWCTTEIDSILYSILAGNKLLYVPIIAPGPAPQPPPPVAPPRGYQYAIAVREASTSCVNSGDTHDEFDSTQSLGVQFASPADRAAWRHDGSPTRWQVPLPPHYSGPAVYLTLRPDRAIQFPTGSAGDNNPWGSNAKLPANAAGLLALLQTIVVNESGEFVPYAGQGPANAQSLMSLLLQVVQAPVAPAVRAAAYEVLADIPGMHIKPDVTDPAGQTGTELWLGNPPTGASRKAIFAWHVSIVDPATGYLLASGVINTRPVDGIAADNLFDYSTFSYRWTNRLPGKLCVMEAQCPSTGN